LRFTNKDVYYFRFFVDKNARVVIDEKGKSCALIAKFYGAAALALPLGRTAPEFYSARG
jgi:hypothetical protein